MGCGCDGVRPAGAAELLMGGRRGKTQKIQDDDRGQQMGQALEELEGLKPHSVGVFLTFLKMKKQRLREAK